MKNTKTMISSYLQQLQKDICEMAATEDGQKTFHEDRWSRDALGHGITQVLSDGGVFEQAGVNYSHVKGNSLPKAATATRPELAGHSFEAMGVSVVMHPKNPFVPTSHFNVRFFVAEKPDHTPVWWFGGGFDLTPYYGFKEDCVHWHKMAKAACDPFADDLYSECKQQCDEYFYLKHRQEARGIGGIIFDDFNRFDIDTCFHFIQSVGSHYIKAYQPIINRRKATPFTQQHRDFQCYRRGRYVEFNLVYDRGTLFGLQSNGRTESILMSLPPVVHWAYDWQPQPDSEEAVLYRDFLPAKDWLAE